MKVMLVFYQYTQLTHICTHCERTDDVVQEDGGLDAAGSCLLASPMNEESLQDAFAFQGKQDYTRINGELKILFVEPVAPNQ